MELIRKLIKADAQVEHIEHGELKVFINISNDCFWCLNKDNVKFMLYYSDYQKTWALKDQRIDVICDELIAIDPVLKPIFNERRCWYFNKVTEKICQVYARKGLELNGSIKESPVFAHKKDAESWARNWLIEQNSVAIKFGKWVAETLNYDSQKTKEDIDKIEKYIKQMLLEKMSLVSQNEKLKATIVELRQALIIATRESERLSHVITELQDL